MGNSILFYSFLVLAVGLTLYLIYLIFMPFLTPILLGMTFSIVFYPLYQKILLHTKGKKALASLLTCLSITMVIIIPLGLLTASFVEEITSAYHGIEEAMRTGEYRSLFPFLDTPVFRSLYEGVGRYLETYQIDIKGLLLNTLKQVSSHAVQVMTGVLMNLARLALNLLLMFITMYYLFKDSEMIAERIEGLLPLKHQQKVKIFRTLEEIIFATLYGSIAVALAQGFLGGAAFWALGIGSPLLWGVVMGLLSFLPMVGAGVVWLPASVILLIQGSYIKAIILLACGGLVISTVDNLIRPILMSGRTMLHPLVLFFSILGGILAFGPIGLIAGPFTVALLIILLDIVREVEVGEG
jgi:predicted PurR-regulated permease PerM